MDAFSNTPFFYIGTIPIYGDLILAPMDGYSDLPFRSLTRELGSAVSYTEFINAIDVVHNHPHLEQRLKYLESERPIVFQILDNDIERILRAVELLIPKQPDVIDVNFGCSAPSISTRGAGAGMLRDTPKIARMIKSLSQLTNIPISAKIRLGWDENSRNFIETAHIIEDNGGKLIAVHARTRKQGYSGKADWDAIAEIKQAVSIPVIGNGDVITVTDIEKMKSHTGCDAVMIGRGAISNPWIFARIDRGEVSPSLLREVILRHLDKNLQFYGPERGLILFRKYAARYLAPLFHHRWQKQQLLTQTQPQQFIVLLNELLGPNSPLNNA